MNANWWDILAAALSGGFVVKLLDYAYDEYKRRSEVSKSAKELVNKHIDPILKAADEIVGKIRSLAQSDFQEIIFAQKKKEDPDSKMPLLEIIFLFGQFWARIQILRMESIYLNLASDRIGHQLLMFIRALEATRTRLVDRAWQRGIGEALIEGNENGFRAMNYYEFMEKYSSSDQFKKWFHPIMQILNRINHTSERQRLLVYGVILHALVDALDEKHLVSGDRPGWANKLTVKSQKELRFRIFKVYLSFVKFSERYYGASRKEKRKTEAPVEV
jgi:hypothetical protein